jgi:uroporphyrinogen decarboxylase
MPTITNDHFLRALKRQPHSYTPLWIMRQAGRYLPEYRALRAKAGSFMALCRDPAAAAEATLQPLRRYNLDAAIIFSDILTIPDAMGLSLHFVEGERPKFAKPITIETDLDAFQNADTLKLDYVYEAISRAQQELSVPLIGFCGSPFTLALYMIEGRAQPGFPHARPVLSSNPQFFHQVLQILATWVAAHLIKQVEAGATVGMIFDTWGGILETNDYQQFSLFYLKQVVDHFKKDKASCDTPLILFTKKGGKWLEAMAETAVHALGIDWEVSLQEAKSRVGNQVALQGNLHPDCLLQSGREIEQAVATVLASYGKGNGHIFNLGHGITPDVPPENVAILIEAVHQLSRQYHE